MKVAFVTDYDATDPRHSSGLGFFMSRAIAAQGIDVRPIAVRGDPWLRAASAVRKAASGLHGRTYIGRRSPRRLDAYARQARQALSDRGFDAVLTPSTIPLAHLEPEQPMVVWTDTTATGLIGFFPPHSRLARATVRHSQEADRASLDRCSLAIFSSNWAAGTALRLFAPDRDKIRVVPFGGNVDPPSEEEIRAIVATRPLDACRLLFVGTHWERKGGPKALEVVGALRALGISAELTVVGPSAAELGEAAARVRVVEWVSKSSERGRRRLGELMARSHFLLLPTTVDCCPHALAEANAFGVPCLTTRLAGIPSAITDDVNGRMFAADAPAIAYAAYVAEVLARPSAYRRLALGSYGEYRARLNWGTAGARVAQLLDEVTRRG